MTFVDCSACHYFIAWYRGRQTKPQRQNNIYPIHPISRIHTITIYLSFQLAPIGKNLQIERRKTKREDWESAIIAAEADEG
jgi:hypothetical protein